MKQQRSVWPQRCFMLAFLVLTFFCWCPLLYGSYGPAKRILGIPSWAIWAFVFGAVLFLVEWVYLFLSHRAMRDEDLPDILSELKTMDKDAPDAAQEGS